MNINEKQIIEPDKLRRFVSPINDPALREIVSRLSVDQFAFLGNRGSVRERVSRVKAFIQIFERYAENFLVGLDGFSHIYVLNGNTDYIHTLISRATSVQFFDSDYRYYKIACEGLAKERSSIGELIFSFPSWRSGADENLILAKTQSFDKRHMDIAYMGLTKMYSVTDVSEFDSVGITLSKTCAMPFNRISIMYSKQSLPHLDLLQSIGYCNLSAIEIAREVLSFLTPDFWIRKYWDWYLRLCVEHKISPTNCLLFATNDKGQRVSTAELFTGES